MKETTEVIIEDLGAQGDGIVHLDGQTLFIAEALPHEKIEAFVTGQRGSIVQILSQSQDRVDPPCPHFPLCGGCRMQHLKFEAYQKWKEQTLRDLLVREGIEVGDFRPIIASPQGSRRRARLAGINNKKEILIGFNQWHSHKILNIETCPVLDPKIVALLPEIRKAATHWLGNAGAVGDIQVSVLENGLDILFIGGGKLTLDVRQDFAELAQAPFVAQISWKKNEKSAAEPIAHVKSLYVAHGDVSVPFPAGSFLQATPFGEASLIAFAKETVGSSKRVLDLFSGLGGFGLSMTEAQEVTFADLDGPAITSLIKATQNNRRYHAVQRDLMRKPFDNTECDNFDAVIFDPPRGGAREQTEQLAKSNVPLLAAISCDPVCFARDAKVLQDSGYTLEALQPVDQFLWSSHLELAARFVKR